MLLRCWAHLGLPIPVMPFCSSVGAWRLPLKGALLLFSDCPPSSFMLVFGLSLGMLISVVQQTIHTQH